MTNPDNAGGLRYTDYNVMNGLLCDFSTRWKMDGDYIRCRACKRPQLTSYGDNDFPHASDCRERNSPLMERRPWQTYVALLAPLCRAAPAGGDDLYRQACESVEEWKTRALEAEADIARIHAQINAENGPTFMGEPVVSAPAGSGEVSYEDVDGLCQSLELMAKGRDAQGMNCDAEVLRCAAALLRKLQQGADYVLVPRSLAVSGAEVCEEWLNLFDETLGLDKYERFTYAPLVEMTRDQFRAASQGQEGGENG